MAAIDNPTDKQVTLSKSNGQKRHQALLEAGNLRVIVSASRGV